MYIILCKLMDITEASTPGPILHSQYNTQLSSSRGHSTNFALKSWIEQNFAVTEKFVSCVNSSATSRLDKMYYTTGIRQFAVVMASVVMHKRCIGTQW